MLQASANDAAYALSQVSADGTTVVIPVRSARSAGVGLDADWYGGIGGSGARRNSANLLFFR